MDQILRSGMENASSVLMLMKAAGTLFSLGSESTKRWISSANKHEIFR